MPIKQQIHEENEGLQDEWMNMLSRISEWDFDDAIDNGISLAASSDQVAFHERVSDGFLNRAHLGENYGNDSPLFCVNDDPLIRQLQRLTASMRRSEISRERISGIRKVMSTQNWQELKFLAWQTLPTASKQQSEINIQPLQNLPGWLNDRMIRSQPYNSS